MSRTLMLKIAGILDIAIGGMAVAIALVALVGGIVSWDEPGGGSFFVMIAIIFAIPGIPAIIGGICALRKKWFPVAIIGSLFTTPVWGIGIVATIFIALSKSEFT